MIIKILKGRSFGGLLDYLFNPQDKPPPREIEARGSTENQLISEVPPTPESSSRETDRAGPSKEMLPGAPTENQQRGDRSESGNANREQRGYLLITNMAGRSKEELLEHFETLAALRPDVEVNVLHGILSMPEEDVLSREAKARIVMRFVELKGLDRTMYAAVEHKEEGHKHTEIHIASSTINFKGKLPSDSFDYDKGEAIARQLEKEFGLKPNRSSRDSMQRAPTQGEWKQHERTGKLSRPLRLQALVNSALNREVTLTEFKERLNRRGVELNLIVNDEGTVVGSVYRFEEKHIRGRRLGRGYTWPGLQRDWPDQQERKGRMTYESKRDQEAFSRARSGAFGRTDEHRKPERPMGSISRDGEATERVERSASADREPSHQTLTVGEEGRGTVRHHRPCGEGTARGDRAAQEEHSDKSQPVQRASDGDRRSGQRRVPTPAQDSSGIFRRDAEDKRQERADGRAMPGDGSDEQRYLQQGQRGSTGSVGENPSASKGRSRSASQGDRDAGAALQDDLQTAEQVNRHRDDSHSLVRLRRRNDGWRDVDSNEATSSRRNPSLDSTMNIMSQEDSNTYSMTGHHAQSTDSKTSAASQTSAVDEVVKTLWKNSSSFEDVADQSTAVLRQEGRIKGKENNRKETEVAISEGRSNREELSVRNRAPLEISKDQADSLPSQKLSQDRQTSHTERSTSGGHGHSR